MASLWLLPFGLLVQIVHISATAKETIVLNVQTNVFKINRMHIADKRWAYREAIFWSIIQSFMRC